MQHFYGYTLIKMHIVFYGTLLIKLKHIIFYSFDFRSRIDKIKRKVVATKPVSMKAEHRKNCEWIRIFTTALALKA